MIYADILFFAVLAIVIFYKLHTVFGKRDGSEDQIRARMQQDVKQREAAAELKKKNVSPIKQELKPQPVVKPVPEPEIADENIAKVLLQMKEMDPRFTIAQFMKGAEMAFEMILKAFSDHDKAILKDLLAREVFRTFDEEIDRLEKEGNDLEIMLVSMKSVNIVAASLKRSKAQITVKFDSEQIRFVKDTEGNIVEGDSSEADEMVDEWVFERDLKSGNPNWVIVAT